MIVAKYYKETALGQCLGFLWGRDPTICSFPRSAW